MGTEILAFFGATAVAALAVVALGGFVLAVFRVIDAMEDIRGIRFLLASIDARMAEEDSDGEGES